MIVAILAHRSLQPVPALVDATLRIAREDTGSATPFCDRGDEIGDMAQAIETLRQAVVERGQLRLVRDMVQQLEHMALHDALTGLPNRVLLMKTLDSSLADYAASSATFNLMPLDIDRFKAVNDTLGHAVGDALLVAAVERIRNTLGSQDIAARLGGSEFAIVQPSWRTPKRRS